MTREAGFNAPQPPAEDGLDEVHPRSRTAAGILSHKQVRNDPHCGARGNLLQEDFDTVADIPGAYRYIGGHRRASTQQEENDSLEEEGDTTVVSEHGEDQSQFDRSTLVVAAEVAPSSAAQELELAAAQLRNERVALQQMQSMMTAQRVDAIQAVAVSNEETRMADESRSGLGDHGTERIARRKRSLVSYFVVLAIIVVTAVVVGLVIGLSSSNDSSKESPQDFPTQKPTEQQNSSPPLMSSPTMQPTVAPTRNTCVGVVVPEFDEMPTSSGSLACINIGIYMGIYYQGGAVDYAGRTWTATCSCSDTIAGARTTCRYNAWRCWLDRQLCSLQTDTIEWLSSFNGVSKSTTTFAYQCGLDDSIVFEYPNRAFGGTSCSMSLNDEPCNSCEENRREGAQACNSFDCSNLELGGMFDTCTGAYHFYGSEEANPFFEYFGGSFSGEGRVPLEFFPAYPGDVPFPLSRH